MTSGSNHSNNNRNRAGACAACRHQRKRCVEDCILAPHFPAERVAELEAVEKVFELSNVENMLRELAPGQQRVEAVNTLIWNAAMWEEYPVHGPLGAIRSLERQLMLARQQLQGIITSIPQQESGRRAGVVPATSTDHHVEDSHLMNQQQILFQLTNETERLRIRDDGEQARQGPWGQENQDTASNFFK